MKIKKGQKRHKAERTDIMVFGERRGECIVEEALPSAIFNVTHTETGSKIICTLSGNMRRFKIKLVPGDSVMIEVSPHDLTRGRIIRRL